jgi:hypothetical protein
VLTRYHFVQALNSADLTDFTVQVSSTAQADMKKLPHKVLLRVLTPLQ